MIECQPDPTTLHHRPSVPSVPVLVALARSQGLQRSAAFCILQPSLSQAKHWSYLTPVSSEAGFARRGCNVGKPSVCALCATSPNQLAAPPLVAAPHSISRWEGISDALARSPSRRKCNEWLSALL